MSTPSRVVYRALLGGYEELREEPVAHETDIPFICITDDPDLSSETWTIVQADPRMPQDLTRSVRAVKILGHPSVDEYDQTLWIDNTVELLRPPDELFDDWLEHADVAAPLHSYRNSVLGEAEAVINAGLEDFARVYEQITHYLAMHPDRVEQNPHWAGIVARRRGDVTTAAMQTWWEHVLRYSRRDQLSFVVAMGSQGVRLNSVPLDSLGSQWHQWPRARGRDLTKSSPSLREVLRPPASRIGVLEEALSDATHSLAHAVAAREEVIASAQAEVRFRDELLTQRAQVVSEVEERLREAEGRLHDANGRILALEREVGAVSRDRAALRLQLRHTRARERQLLAQAGSTSEQLRQARRRARRLEGRLRQRPRSALTAVRRRVRRLLRRSA